MVWSDLDIDRDHRLMDRDPAGWSNRVCSAAGNPNGSAGANPDANKHRWRITMRNTAALVLALSLAGGTLAAQDTTIETLLIEELVGRPDKEITMVTVEYAPGAVDPVHAHHAQAMVYVLEGSVVMQVKGKEPRTLTPGQTFYESPGDVHVVARNASRTARAKFVVFFVKDKGAPLLVPAK
jgi:quercetin dioxygenase-like cupin family protein